MERTGKKGAGKTVLDKLMTRLRSGKMVTREHLLRWGSANPSGHVALARKKGEHIIFVRNRATSFWMAPHHSRQKGFPWARYAAPQKRGCFAR